MKKRIIVLVAALLCVVMALSSCTLGASSVLAKDFKADPTLTTATKVDVAGDLGESRGVLATFTDTDDEGVTTTIVYNFATGTKVWEGKSEIDVEAKKTTAVTVTLKVYEDVSWFYAVTIVTKDVEDDDDEVTVTWTLRDADGNEFATATADDLSKETVENYCDLIRFDEKVYRIDEKGKIEFAFDRSDLAGMPRLVQKAGKYYFAYEIDQYTHMPEAISIYNSKLELTAYYDFPADFDADEDTIGLLNNGNLLIQYSVEEPDTAEEWSYIEDGVKYTLITKVINAKNGKINNVDLEYVLDGEVMSYAAADFLWEDLGIKESVANLAAACPIVDGRVEWDNDVLVELSNKGKVKGEIELIDNMVGEFYQIADGRWIVGNKAGEVFLINRRGKVVANITAAGEVDGNVAFFEADGKLYNWDAEEKYDLEKNKYEIEDWFDNSIVLENEEGALVLMKADTTTTEIVAKDAEGVSYDKLNRRLYYIATTTDGKTEYKIYNDLGAAVVTIKDCSNVGVYTTLEDGTVILNASVTTDEGVETVYYRVTAAE